TNVTRLSKKGRRMGALLLLQRVLFQDLFDRVEDGAVLEGGARLGDFLGLHHRQIVAEGLVHVGKHGGDLVILEQRGEAGHRRRPSWRSRWPWSCPAPGRS